MEQFARVAMVVMVIGACVPADPVAETAQDSMGGCPPEGCNSPIIATYEFHDLSLLTPTKNAEGFWIEGFRMGPIQYGFDVKSGRIIGHNLVFGDLIGTGLEGAVIQLARFEGLNTMHYEIEITEVEEVDYWAQPTPIASKKLERYKLHWTEGPYNASRAQPLCIDDVQDDEESLGLADHWAVVYEGDRINRKLRVIYDIDPTWFNIGCAGHAIAKLALTGHSSAGIAAGYDTTRDERQAMLKMLSADYCGNGRALTVPGVRVEWHDAHSYNDYISMKVFVEARWTKDGAYCLNTPRIIAHETDASRHTFPNPWQAIRTACGFRPPPCSNTDEDRFDLDNYLISANPSP